MSAIVSIIRVIQQPLSHQLLDTFLPTAARRSKAVRLHRYVEFAHDADGTGDQGLTQVVSEAFRKDQFNDTIRPGGQAYEHPAIADWARGLDPDGPWARQE
jgi:hypothetical protein